MSWWNDYVGIPYRDAGRAQTGCDCAGLVVLVYKERLGIDLADEFGFYDPQDSKQSADLLQQVSRGWQKVEEPQDFDVVKLLVMNDPCHVGIVCNGGKSVLNTRLHVNAVIEPLHTGKWATRIDSFWRQKQSA